MDRCFEERLEMDRFIHRRVDFFTLIAVHPPQQGSMLHQGSIPPQVLLSMAEGGGIITSTMRRIASI